MLFYGPIQILSMLIRIKNGLRRATTLIPLIRARMELSNALAKQSFCSPKSIL
jgi:hypothetical protein